MRGAVMWMVDSRASNKRCACCVSSFNKMSYVAPDML